MRTELTDTTWMDTLPAMAYTAVSYQQLYAEEAMYGHTKPLTPQNIQGTLHTIWIRSLGERIEDRRKDQLG
jgi:hypothetical protein